MKKIKHFLLLLCLGLSSFVYGQDHDRRHSIGLYQNFTDYNVQLLDGKLVAWDSSLSLTTRLGYQYRISSAWLVNTGVSQGFINNQSLRDRVINRSRVYGIDGSLMYALNNGVLIKKDAVLAPYLAFGYRADYVAKLKSYDTKPWLFLNQYALGLNVSLSSRTHIQCQAAIDQKLMGDFNTHMRYRIGITQSLGAFESVVRLTDADGDGVPDANDACPEVYGTLSSSGCPDTVSVAAEPSQKYDSLLQAHVALREDHNDCATIQRRLQSSVDSLQDQIVKSTSASDSTAVVSEQESEQDSVAATPPAVVTPKPSVNRQYFVIVVSVKSLDVAKVYQSKLKASGQASEIIEQANGFYRVGVPVGKNYRLAKKSMLEIKRLGYDPVWLIKI